MLCAAGAAAQTGQRCDLGSPRIAGTQNKDTLDMSRIDGQTVNVPLSVTRISRDAFAFHKGNSTVDIVYVLDHSTSMKVDGYWKSDDGTQVRYIRETEGLLRTQSQFSDCGVLQINYGGGLSTKNLTKVCGPFDPILDELTSGDPFGSASYAVREAIGEQASLAPISRAAYLPFDVESAKFAQQELVRLDSIGNVNLLFDAVDNAKDFFRSSTDYTEPLELAKQWLADSDNPVVFFVTDLRPNENGMAELTTYMQNYSIPVYGVFIGVNEPTAVKNIFEQSGNGGGSFYHISPEHTDSLKIILKQFVGELLAWSPSGGAVENKTASVSAAAAGASSFTSQGGYTLMNTDHEVALREGPNEVRVMVEFTSTEGVKDVREATFTVNVGGVPEDGFVEDLLGIYCGPKSSLEITDQAYNAIGSLQDAAQFGVVFNTGPAYAGNAVDLAITTDADSETKSHAVQNTGSRTSGSDLYSLSVGGSIAVDNGAVEASVSDELTVRWRHPHDPRDTAFAAVQVSQGVSVLVSSATYRDGRGDSADGCVDTIALFLDPASALATGGADISVVNQWKDNFSFGGDLAGLRVQQAVKISDTRINLIIAPNAATPSGPQTMTITAPPVRTDGFLSWSSANSVLDGIAPVIVRTAHYRLADDEDGVDTVEVMFSEPVDFSGTESLSPFLLKQGATEYFLDLTVASTSGAAVTFLVQGEPRVPGGQSGGFPASGDSISIYPGQVSEKGGTNMQREKINRRALLKITGSFSWELRVSPNPFDPTKPWDKAMQQAFGAGGGAIIMIQTRTKLNNLAGITGTVAVYDGVGNMMWRGDELKFDQKGMYFIWDGRNRNGRIVGPGGYVALVNLTLPDGAVEKEFAPIGVSRK